MTKVRRTIVIARASSSSSSFLSSSSVDKNFNLGHNLWTTTDRTFKSLSQHTIILYARLQMGRILVWWCLSVHPSVRVSVRQSQFSALFSFMLWRFELKFGMSLSCYEHSIKFECRQFPSSFVGVMPLLELKIQEIHRFPQFSPTCFDILRWNVAYDFILMYYRSSLSVINFRQFL